MLDKNINLKKHSLRRLDVMKYSLKKYLTLLLSALPVTASRHPDDELTVYNY